MSPAPWRTACSAEPPAPARGAGCRCCRPTAPPPRRPRRNPAGPRAAWRGRSAPASGTRGPLVHLVDPGAGAGDRGGYPSRTGRPGCGRRAIRRGRPAGWCVSGRRSGRRWPGRPRRWPRRPGPGRGPRSPPSTGRRSGRPGRTTARGRSPAPSGHPGQEHVPEQRLRPGQEGQPVLAPRPAHRGPEVPSAASRSPRSRPIRPSIDSRTPRDAARGPRGRPGSRPRAADGARVVGPVAGDRAQVGQRLGPSRRYGRAREHLVEPAVRHGRSAPAGSRRSRAPPAPAPPFRISVREGDPLRLGQRRQPGLVEAAQACGSAPPPGPAGSGPARCRRPHGRPSGPRPRTTRPRPRGRRRTRRPRRPR